VVEVTDGAAGADRPLLLDELGDQLERFRLLRKSDDEATDSLLDGLGAHSPVDRDIITELSSTRPLGRPERFEEAHVLAMRALEVLDRNGARQVPVPKRLGPLKPVAATLVGWVTRFIVRSHQAEVIDDIANLYERRVASSPPGHPDRLVLLRASRDARRINENYKGNPIGVPTFLLGGAAISALWGMLRSAADVALGNRAAAISAVVVLTVLFGGVAWVILRGAAVARRRIRLTTERPLAALWQTIGRAGDPPRDRARTFAVYGILLTAASWFVVPAGIVFVLSRF
jgi:hypothetical protein